MKNEQKEEKIIGRRMGRKRKLECGEGGKTRKEE
jgi:hypothetical protein